MLSNTKITKILADSIMAEIIESSKKDDSVFMSVYRTEYYPRENYTLTYTNDDKEQVDIVTVFFHKKENGDILALQITRL